MVEITTSIAWPLESDISIESLIKLYEVLEFNEHRRRAQLDISRLRRVWPLYREFLFYLEKEFKPRPLLFAPYGMFQLKLDGGYIYCREK